MTRSAIRAGSIPIRPALGIVALVATIVIGAHALFGVGGVFDRAHISAAEAQALRAPQAPTIHQAASAACFHADAAVAQVRSSGDDVFVRFVGRRIAMRIQYLTDERAAIRYAYAHPDPLPNNDYDNTNWFDVPAFLTHDELDALSACLPLPGDRF